MSDTFAASVNHLAEARLFSEEAGDFDSPEEKHREEKISRDAARNSTVYLFLGNPGSGKSTLANTAAGKLLFESGASYGSGMTVICQSQLLEQGPLAGQRVADAPGLSDPITRRKAAAEITKALKYNTNYKLIFVLSLESGRVRPDDCATVVSILLALPKGVPYNIIINKVSRRCLADLEDPANRTKLMASVATVVEQAWAYASDPLFVEHDPEAYDAPNCLLAKPIASGVIQWLKRAPSAAIPQAKVLNVQAETYQKLCQDIKEVNATLMKDKEKAEEKAQQLQKQVDIEKEKVESLRKDLQTRPTEIHHHYHDTDSGGGNFFAQVLPAIVESAVIRKEIRIGDLSRNLIMIFHSRSSVLV
eukprot:g53434.t1